jgi:hypothetical protein
LAPKAPKVPDFEQPQEEITSQQLSPGMRWNSGAFGASGSQRRLVPPTRELVEFWGIRCAMAMNATPQFLLTGRYQGQMWSTAATCALRVLRRGQLTSAATELMVVIRDAKMRVIHLLHF